MQKYDLIIINEDHSFIKYEGIVGAEVLDILETVRENPGDIDTIQVYPGKYVEAL